MNKVKYIAIWGGICATLFFLISIMFYVEIVYETADTGNVRVYYQSPYASDNVFEEKACAIEPLPGGEGIFQMVRIPIPMLFSGKLMIKFEGISGIVLDTVKLRTSKITLQTFRGAKLQEKFLPNENVLSAELMGEWNNYTFSQALPALTNLKVFQPASYIVFVVALMLVSGGMTIGIAWLFRNKKIAITRAHIFVGSFLFILLIPSILRFYGQGGGIGSENRTLAEKPTLDAIAMQQFPKDYEAYYDDHVPYKDLMVRAVNSLRYHLLNVSPVKAVIIGKNDWLFYNSKANETTNTVADYQGENCYSEETMNQIIANFESLDAYCEQRGIELFVMIPPNKMSIYPEYMSDAYTRTEETRVDGLVKRMREVSDIPLIYPKDALIANKDMAQLYFKQDSHWNEAGAYVGYRELIAAMKGKELPTLQDVMIQEEPVNEGDLSIIMNVWSGFEDKQWELNVETNKNITIDPDNSQHIVSYSDTGEGKVLVFRDSFSISLVPHIAYEFYEGAFYWQKFIDKDIIDREAPDYLVVEILERMTSSLNEPGVFFDIYK